MYETVKVTQVLPSTRIPNILFDTLMIIIVEIIKRNEGLCIVKKRAFIAINNREVSLVLVAIL